MNLLAKKSLTVFTSLALAVTAAACSSGGAGNDEAAESQVPGSESSHSASPTESDGSLAKYDPPITIRTTAAEAKDFLNEGETTENNVWTQGYEQELGIKVKYDWITKGDNYTDKMNITLASGDLPDLLNVNQTQYKQLLDAGQLEDLSEVYEKYASELVKKFYTMGTDGLKPVRQDDKLYGLTYYSGSYDTSPMLWIRTDWMQNLNLEPPKTMDDVMNIAKAFTEQDPDKNGKKDTYGLELNKDLMGGGDMNPKGLMNGYHAYPGIWFKDGSGKLVYGSIQPEMKTALARLAEMFKAGYIDPEFATKDVAKASETVMAGKAGMFFGFMTSPFSVSGMITNENQIDWLPYPIPSADDKPAKVQNEVSYGNIWAIRKGYEHPEALIKLMNFAVEKTFGESAKTEAAKFIGESGQGFHVAPIKLLEPNKNVGIYHHVVDALEANDPSKLNREEKSYYDGITSYRGGDRSQWWFERIFGPDSSQKIIQHYIDNDSILLNEFVYPPTKTMATKGATLGKLELETFMKIIYGNVPIDEFDTFVQNWKKLGGDQMTEEVNQLVS
ncbi:extracellular solute-binding protein [Cohnella zeiphila]|uniref:Extracellular solute-binding protein n=1 Tax=Cohnella zeiphila TaxID=2761120 RepID=A0A7X0SJX9_9BACL|nr:extracellular solute-binding protein [Cohnella zeiphila]MBB6731337.1 extracellular solute-binding protein [Cohnella zeiphila]